MGLFLASHVPYSYAEVFVYEQLKQQIEFEEGRKLHVYLCPAGHRTIGIGHNLDVSPDYNGVPIRDVISDTECDTLFNADVKHAVDGISAEWLGFKALSPARRDAIINMAFQLGVAGVLKFRGMLTALDLKHWQKAHDMALDSLWAKQTPNRAKRIAQQLLTGDYYIMPK